VLGLKLGLAYCACVRVLVSVTGVLVCWTTGDTWCTAGSWGRCPKLSYGEYCVITLGGELLH